MSKQIMIILLQTKSLFRASTENTNHRKTLTNIEGVIQLRCIVKNYISVYIQRYICRWHNHFYVDIENRYIPPLQLPFSIRTHQDPTPPQEVLKQFVKAATSRNNTKRLDCGPLYVQPLNYQTDCETYKRTIIYSVR